MSVRTVILTFLRAESGAVTVDWVVLTAAITGLGLASAAAVRDGSSALGGEIDTSLTAASVVSLGCLGSGSGPAGWECYDGPTISAVLGGRARSSSGTCTLDDAGVMTCTPSVRTTAREYLMSDGQTFTRTTVQTGDGPAVTTWRNDSGEIVDAPPPMPV